MPELDTTMYSTVLLCSRDVTDNRPILRRYVDDPQIVGMSEYSTVSMSACVVAYNILADMRPGGKTRLHLAAAQLMGYGDMVVLYFSRHHPRAAAVAATGFVPSPYALLAPADAGSTWVRVWMGGEMYDSVFLTAFPSRSCFRRGDLSLVSQ